MRGKGYDFTAVKVMLPRPKKPTWSAKGGQLGPWDILVNNAASPAHHLPPHAGRAVDEASHNLNSCST